MIYEIAQRAIAILEIGTGANPSTASPCLLNHHTIPPHKATAGRSRGFATEVFAAGAAERAVQHHGPLDHYIDDATTVDTINSARRLD